MAPSPSSPRKVNFALSPSPSTSMKTVWPVWISFALAIIAFMFLRSGLDRDQLLEQQAEQKRLLEEEKARRAGAKAGAPKQKIQVQRKR